MRNDLQGFFWHEEIVEKAAPKEKRKLVPPEPVWESPTFIPKIIEIACQQTYVADLMTTGEIVSGGQARDTLFCDVESYADYFLICFESLTTKKKHYEQLWHGETNFNIPRITWILQNYTIITFNGINYDIPIIRCALTGLSAAQLHHITQLLIVGEEEEDSEQTTKVAHWEITKRYKAPKLTIDHIDLSEHTSASCRSLKGSGARIHTKRVQDLPFPPLVPIGLIDRMLIVRWYCFNDLQVTRDFYEEVKELINYRIMLGQRYGIDLRSKSDAQIAEAVIVSEAEKLTGKRIQKPEFTPNTKFFFSPFPYITFQTLELQKVLYWAQTYPFVINQFGQVVPPHWLANKTAVEIDGEQYAMGIGGLHSVEKKRIVRAENGYKIKDFDVTSYYPKMILTSGMFPPAIGALFLRIYGGIIEERIAAKRGGNDVLAQILKIVGNGTFGKLGEKHSKIYAPHLMIQTTLNGQLSVLMLIEKFVTNGIKVISANTDGVTTYCHESQEALRDKLAEEWSQQTKLELEAVTYSMLASRDVNNYIAHYADEEINGKKRNKTKTKGIFTKTCLAKSAKYEISHTAVVDYLTKGVPIEQTIRNCKDVRGFVIARRSKSGAVYKGEYLGKYVRYYYATDATEPILAAKTGGKVAESDGSIPMMELADSLPDNIDYAKYIKTSERILTKLGYGMAN